MSNLESQDQQPHQPSFGRNLLGLLPRLAVAAVIAIPAVAIEGKPLWDASQTLRRVLGSDGATYDDVSLTAQALGRPDPLKAAAADAKKTFREEEQLSGMGEFRDDVYGFDESYALPVVKDASGKVLGRMVPYKIPIPEGTNSKDRKAILALGVPFTPKEIAGEVHELNEARNEKGIFGDSPAEPQPLFRSPPLTAEDFTNNWVKVQSTETATYDYATREQYAQFIAICGLVDAQRREVSLPAARLEYAVYQGLLAEANNRP
jgi:hypothetical protein